MEVGILVAAALLVFTLAAMVKAMGNAGNAIDLMAAGYGSGLAVKWLVIVGILAFCITWLVMIILGPNGFGLVIFQ